MTVSEPHATRLPTGWDAHDLRHRPPGPGDYQYPPGLVRPVPRPAPSASHAGQQAGSAPAAWWQRLAWLGVLVGGGALYAVVQSTLVTTQNPTIFPVMLLLGAVTVPAAVLTWASLGGSRPIGSPGLVWLTAIVGGVIGVVIAGTLENDIARHLGALPMIMVAVVEEAAKIVVPLVLLVVTGARDPRLGAILGVAAGMGFAVLETMGYGFNALLATGGNLAAVDQTLVLRAVLSPACHIAWTGVVVAALWAIPTAEDAVAAWLRAFCAAAGAVALHALWNSLDLGLAHTALGLVSVTALVVVMHRTHRARPVLG